MATFKTDLLGIAALTIEAEVVGCVYETPSLVFADDTGNLLSSTIDVRAVTSVPSDGIVEGPFEVTLYTFVTRE